MKRVSKWMLMFFCSFLLCMGCSMKAMAATEYIRVNGVDLLTSNETLEGVSYDDRSNTLTLDSLELNIDSDNAGIGIEIKMSSINLVLNGTTAIEGYDSGGIGIFSTGDLNISGTGSLSIGNCVSGIMANGDMTMNGGRLTVSAIYSGIEVSRLLLQDGQLSVNASDGHAIVAGNGVEVTGGDLSVLSRDYNTVQIDNGAFLQTGGSVEITPNDGTQPIYAFQGIKIHGGKIKLNGNMSRAIFLKNGTQMSLAPGAWFSPDDTYRVTVVNGSGSGYYKVGDTVTISAGQNTNTKKFAYWMPEENSNLNLADAEANTTTFVMPMKSVTVTAYILEPLENNTYISAGNASYVVINGKFNNPTVAYWGHVRTSKKIKTVTIPDTFTFEYVTYKVVEISKEAFLNNKDLKTLKIGNNVTKIGKNAFRNCKSLQKVTFGNKVKTIESSAFYGCKKLKNITFKGTSLNKVKSKAFKNIHKKAVIKVPSKKYKKYKKLLKKSSVGLSKKVKIKK